MENLKYVNFNGSLKKADMPLIAVTNRAFLYGDALFETMHANGSEIQFLHAHYERLVRTSAKLKFILPQSFTIEFLGNEIKRLFNRNRYYKGARVRLTLFRNSGGFYSPQDNNCTWLIEASKLPADNYVLNSKGLTIDVFEDITKPVNYFSDMKTANSLLFVMAGINSKENSVDDSLILNEEGDIIEASSSNIFIVKDNVLVTPDCNTGCLPGIMRQQIINIAQTRDFPLLLKEIKPESLLNADEVFLTNAVKGISWVLAYKSKRYYNSFAKLLIQELNKIAFP